MYQNHEAVAYACRHAGVAPHELVVTTKVWPMGREATFASVVAAVRQLDGCGQVVALLHWPGATPAGRPRGHGSAREPPGACRVEGRPHDWRLCRLESLLALKALREAGLVAAVGVSNFSPRHMELLREDALAAEAGDATVATPAWPPDVLQTEVHPWWREDALLELCRAAGTQVVAFGSLGSPERKAASLADPAIRSAARAAGLAPAQALLLWALGRGLRVIPTTTSEAHMLEALQLAGPGRPALGEAAAALDALPQLTARIYDPDPDEVQ